MRIFLIKKKDFSEITKLFINSYEREDASKRWTEKMAGEYIAQQYRLNKELCFACKQDGKIVGVIFGYIKPEFDKYIFKNNILIVHPEYRKQRIATRLINRLFIKVMTVYNIDVVETSVDTTINFPISWYESIGFRERKNHSVIRGSIKEVLKLI